MRAGGPVVTQPGRPPHLLESSWVCRLRIACDALAVLQAVAAVVFACWWLVSSVRMFLLSASVMITPYLFLMLALGCYLFLSAFAMFLLSASEKRYPDRLKEWRRLVIIAAYCSAA